MSECAFTPKRFSFGSEGEQLFITNQSGLDSNGWVMISKWKSLFVSNNVFACLQDVLNTIIRSCSSRFFFLGLPGFTLLVGDFITSSARILSSYSSEVRGNIQHVV